MATVAEQLRDAVTAKRPCDLGAIDATSVADAEWRGREVDAADVATQIAAAVTARHRFELNGARIRGRLVLRDLKFEVPVALTSCWVEDGLELDFSTMSELSLNRSRIGATDGVALSMRFATVAGDLCLTGAAIEGRCRLASATISGSIDASGLKVDVPAAAADDRLERWALDLTNAKVASDIGLRAARLVGGINLAGADVSGQLNLIGATVTASSRPLGTGQSPSLADYSAVWAQRATVGESVLAYPDQPAADTTVPATFTGYVAFISAGVAGGLNVRGARFQAPPLTTDGGAGRHFGEYRPAVALDLYDCSVGDVLQLEEATAESTQQVDLRNCTAGEFRPGTSLWRRRHYGVAGLTYDRTDETGRVRRQWIKHSHNGDVPGPYLTVATVAAANGRSSDELKAKIRASSTAANPVERSLLGWVRYGYRPYLVAIPLVLLGALAFFQVEHTRDKANGFAPVTVGSTSYTVSTCDEAVVTCLDSALYALDSVVPLDLGQTSTWRPNRDSTSGNVLSWIDVVNNISSWLLAGVFVAAVSGVLKRT